MRLYLGAIIKTKRGEIVEITAIPDAAYIYGRVVPTNTFIIVRCSDITSVSSAEQRRLFV